MENKNKPTPSEATDAEELQLLHEIDQIFMGWHCDIAWSEYDRSVHKRLQDRRDKLYHSQQLSQEKDAPVFFEKDVKLLMSIWEETKCTVGFVTEELNNIARLHSAGLQKEIEREATIWKGIVEKQQKEIEVLKKDAEYLKVENSRLGNLYLSILNERNRILFRKGSER